MTPLDSTQEQQAEHTPERIRVRTIEREPGWGWIARDPRTGVEVLPDFRWASRSAARDVVDTVRALNAAIAKTTGRQA